MLLDRQLPDRRRGRRRQRLPGADRGARSHDLGQEARAPRVAGRNAGRRPDADAGAVGRQSLEQLLQAILRMARLEPLPARLVEVLVEAGQDDRALRQAGDHLEQGAGRRNAAGRAGGDDPRFGRGRAPAFGESGEQAVAALRGVERALLGEQVRPGLGEDQEHPPALLPVLGEDFGDQAVECGEGNALGLQLIQERCELAGQAKGMLERPVEGSQQAGEQQLAAQGPDRAAAGRARECHPGAARRPRFRRSAESAAAAERVRPRGAEKPRRGSGRPAGSGAGPACRRAPGDRRRPPPASRRRAHRRTAGRQEWWRRP